VLETVESTLSDDDKWSKCAFTVLLKKADESEFAVTISPSGIAAYNEIMTALLGLFV
jgi:hypothetical protein